MQSDNVENDDASGKKAGYNSKAFLQESSFLSHKDFPFIHFTWHLECCDIHQKQRDVPEFTGLIIED
jgi:hypothetical protein